MARARGFSRGRRADYRWSTDLAVFAAVGASSSTAFLGSAGLFSLAGTIMRVRGAIVVMMDPSAADVAMTAAVGMILASDDAITAGAASLPSPSDDLDAEWLWHGFFPLRSITGVQSDIVGGQVIQREIDSKAMRKFKGNQQLAIVADSVISSGASTFDVQGGVRVLIAT